MDAISQIPAYRPAGTIHDMMEAQQRLVDYLMRLAADFYSIDMRPIVFDRTMVTRVGPDPLPQQLRDFIAAEAMTLARLRAEYHDAMQREHQLWRHAQ